MYIDMPDIVRGVFEIVASLFLVTRVSEKSSYECLETPAIVYSQNS